MQSNYGSLLFVCSFFILCEKKSCKVILCISALRDLISKLFSYLLEPTIFFNDKKINGIMFSFTIQ